MNMQTKMQDIVGLTKVAPLVAARLHDGVRRIRRRLYARRRSGARRRHQDRHPPASPQAKRRWRLRAVTCPSISRAPPASPIRR